MKRKYIIPGLLLIFAGLYFLIAALPGILMPKGLFFIAIGAALLVSRLFARKRYGLTIAGFLLLWLGTGRLMLDVLHIGAQYALVSVPLSIALAFFMTHIFEYRRIGNWPMIPGLILLGFAVMFFLILTPSVNAILKPYYGTILPLLLIILGIVVLIRGAKRNKKAVQQPIEVKFEPAEENNVPSPDQWAQPPVEEPAAPDCEEPVTVIPEVEIPAQEPAEEAPAAMEEEPFAAAEMPAEAAAAPVIELGAPAEPIEEIPEVEKKPEKSAE